MIASLRFVGRIAFGWLLLTPLLLVPAVPIEPPADLPVEVFEVGLARSVVSNVNANDAIAAYDVLLENIGRRHGYRIKGHATIYDETSAFAAAIKRGGVHLATMDTWQYLQLEADGAVRPYFVAAANGRVGRRFLVLARRGSGIHTVADLRGQSVLWLDSVNNNVCRHWLETLLPDHPAAAASSFFETFLSAAKPTTAVLPVFFGQKVACVVDDLGFNLMKEMNPQVGKVIDVIASSDVFVDIVICLGEQPWAGPPEGKADTVKAMAELGVDPAGQQILNLFKIARLVAFQDEQIATVRALRRSCEQRQHAPETGASHP